MTEGDEETHYLDVLNKHLTRKQLSLPKVLSCVPSDTPTGILYTLILRVPDLSIVCEWYFILSSIHFIE